MHRFAAIGAGTAADSASPLAGGLEALDALDALDGLDAFEPALEAPGIAGATAAGSAALDAAALDGALDGALAAASDASVSRGTAARRDPPAGGAMP